MIATEIHGSAVRTHGATIPHSDRSRTHCNAIGDTAERNPPQELQRAAADLRHAAIPDPSQRVIAVFLGTDAFHSTGRSSTGLMGDLLLECLPRFVASQGGHLVHAMAFGDNGLPTTVGLKHVTVDDVPRPILDDGLQFIDLGGRRAVVSVKRFNYGRHEQACEIKVAADAGDPAELLATWKVFARGDNFLRGRAFFADGKILRPRSRKHTWDDVVLPEPTLRTVLLHVERFLHDRHRLAELGVKPRRGLMLAGPPGTGKTLLCKVLADVLDCSFLWVTPRHLISPWSFEEILGVARFVTPTVLLLDDIDLYATQRDGTESSVLLGELMSQLDGAAENRDLIVVATTNRLNVVERALRNRPGRFDRVIQFGCLDQRCRRQLLARLLARAVVPDTELAHLAHQTYGYTGAQLEELANTLYMMSVEAGDGSSGPPVIHRTLSERALRDVGVERKSPIGFQ